MGRSLEKIELIFSRRTWVGSAGVKPNPILNEKFFPLLIPQSRNLPSKDTSALPHRCIRGRLPADFHRNAARFFPSFESRLLAPLFERGVHSPRMEEEQIGGPKECAS
jgi:hypothetical protein